MKTIGMIIVFIIVAVVSIIYIILNKARNKVKENYSALETNFKKRWDIIPNLVETVKQYSVFEESFLEKLELLRNQQYENFNVEQKVNIDENISKVLTKMMEMAEDYSELKSDESYINLSKQLNKLENDIVNNKDEYNKFAKEYNRKIEAIPNNIVAILFGFNEEKVFDNN